MLKIIPCCDVCGRNLPVDEIDFMGEKINVVRATKTKVWETSQLFQYLCPECALTIDNALLKFKLEVLSLNK